jgi:hypothetical protein
MAEQEQVVDPKEGGGSTSEGNTQETTTQEGGSEERVKELEGQLSELRNQLKDAGPEKIKELQSTIHINEVQNWKREAFDEYPFAKEMSTEVKGDTRNEVFASARRVHDAIKVVVDKQKPAGSSEEGGESTSQSSSTEEGTREENWKGGGGGTTTPASGEDEAPENPKSRALWRSKGIAAQVVGMGKRVVEEAAKRR